MAGLAEALAAFHSGWAFPTPDGWTCFEDAPRRAAPARQDVPNRRTVAALTAPHPKRLIRRAGKPRLPATK